MSEIINVTCPHCAAVNRIPKKESYKKANCGSCKKSLLDTTPINALDSDFDMYLVNNDLPVVVDFWAPWCGPCKSMGPVFEKVASNYPLKIRFVKVNTESEQSIGARFGIRSIPTLILFKGGKELDRVSGALPEIQLKEWIARFS